MAVREEVPVEIREDRHGADCHSLGAVCDSVAVRVRNFRDGQGCEEDGSTPNDSGVNAPVPNGNLPSADAGQILESQFGPNESVRLRQASRSSDIEEEVDPLPGPDDLGTPRDAETFEHLDESTGGERHRPGDRVDREGREVPRARPGSQVARGRTGRRRCVVFVVHQGRHGPNRLVARAVSRADLERVQFVREVECLVREGVRLIVADVDEGSINPQLDDGDPLSIEDIRVDQRKARERIRAARVKERELGGAAINEY